MGVQAEPHLAATAFANFQKPVRIGQRLAGESDDVRRAVAQRFFCLTKVMYTAGQHDGRVESRLADCRADARHSIDVAAKRSFRVGRDTSELQSRFDLVCRLLLEKKTQEKSGCRIWAAPSTAARLARAR